MDDLRGLINLVLAILVLGGMLLAPLLERRKRRHAQEERRRATAEAEEGGPPPEEPKLPLEDLIDEVFGPYIERRRRQVVVVEEAPPAEEETPAESVDTVEIVEEEKPAEPLGPPAPERPRWEPTGAGPLGVRAAVSSVSGPPHRSLEERIFRNPRLSAGAKLFLAAEILKPPRLLRKGRGVLPCGPGSFRPAGLDG